MGRKTEPQLKDLERVTQEKGTCFERSVWKIKRTRTRHHPTQPAVEWNDGSWAWYWMDREHRWDGPSSFRCKVFMYCIHGKRLTREEWLRHPLRLEWLKTQLEWV